MNQEFLAYLFDRGIWLIVIIVFDLILGVIASLKRKQFSWEKLADFLGSAAPKVLAWVMLEILNLAPADQKSITGITAALATGAYTAILVSYTASLLGHIQALGVLARVNLPGITKM